MNEWISIKDCLPEVNQRVLVYKPNTRYEEVRVQITEWYFNLTLKGSDLVTHWMPLPEPPRE